MKKWVAMILSTLLLVSCGGGQDSAGPDAVEQKTYKWKMVTSWPKNYPGLGMGPENFSTLVDRMSNGRLKVRVFGAGDLVPALEVFDAVSLGTVEMGHAAAYYWKGKTPAAPFFTAVPFGLNVQEMNGWLHHGGGLELWREVYAPFNLVPFAGGSTGVQMGGWFNKEINTPEDIKGLKMRIPGLGGEVIGKLGGQSVTIPGGELYTSLQTNVIDATEWVGPYNDQSLGFHQVAKYYYYPGWQEPGAILEFVVNKQAYESLPPDLQAIVEAAARVVNQDMLDEYTARNNAALQDLISKHGVQVKPFPKEVLASLRNATDQVLTELAAADPLVKKVHDSQMAFKKSVMEYHKVSEEAMYQARRP